MIFFFSVGGRGRGDVDFLFSKVQSVHPLYVFPSIQLEDVSKGSVVPLPDSVGKTLPA